MPHPPEILSALTIPFNADGSLNEPAFRTNAEWLKPLVDGVFVAGTTGEFPALESAEYESLISAALDVFGPARVVAHVGAPSTRQSLILTRIAARLGTQRFAALTPYYLPASTAGITRHWGTIKEACQGELYGYIYPDVAGTDLHPNNLPTVLASGIDGIKVSGTASGRVPEYLSQAPDGFRLWSGNDADLPAVLAAGGTGTVSGCSGSCPGPWAAFRDSWSHDDAACAAAQKTIETIVPIIGPSIARLKYALDIQGLTGGSCRMSIDPPDDNTRAAIQHAVALA